MLSPKPYLLTLGLLLFVGRPASADFINGGFESGLTGWSAAGDVIAAGAGIGTPPFAGSGHALLTTASQNGDANNFSGSNAVAASALETFLGLAAGALAPGVEGSALRQTFTAQAGDIVTLRYNFLTTEGANPDFAFVTLTNLSTLANTSSGPFTPSGVILDPVFGDPTSETGYRTFTFTIPTDGTYTLGVGVLDAGDEFLPSALLLDGASVQPAGPATVPTPAAALLLGLGAITVLTVRRIRRQ